MESQHGFQNLVSWTKITEFLKRKYSLISFSMYLFSGTKETAHAYAITSAGVVYFITRTCSSGHMPDCKCDTSSSGQVDKSGKWKWAECHKVYSGIKGPVKLIKRVKIARSLLQSVSDQFLVIILSLHM